MFELYTHTVNNSNIFSSMSKYSIQIVFTYSQGFVYYIMVQYFCAVLLKTVSSSEVDEPRTCYTKWSKSEREKQISYVNTYMWNLEKWYWWTYLQGRNWDANVENEICGHRGESGRNGGNRIDMYTQPCVKQIACERLLCNTGNSAWHSVMT